MPQLWLYWPSLLSIDVQSPGAATLSLSAVLPTFYHVQDLVTARNSFTLTGGKSTVPKAWRTTISPRYLYMAVYICMMYDA